MDPITVTELDKYGVVVDTDRSGAPSGTLTKAQNASSDPLGEHGSVRKRPGLKRFNASAGAGAVKGGIGVPIGLGSAGPNIGNPFTDLTATIARYTAAVTGSTQRLGATFNDDSFLYDFDWLSDFLDYVALFDPDADTLDVSGQDDGLSDGSSMLPITFFGDVTGFWYLTLNDTLTEDTDNTTNYSSAATQIFPSGSVRAYNGSGAGSGGFGDPNYPLADWYTAAYASREDGVPTCNLNGVLYYVGGYTDYTLGTTAPVLRAYDGISDRIVLRLPKNPDVSATAPARAIVTLLAANNRVYLTTFDGGVGGVAGGTVKGSVYEFNPVYRSLRKLGATFPVGHLPFSLCWAYDRLFCGTAVNQQNDNEPGRVYWIRTNILSEIGWTLDHTFATNEPMVMSLAVFQGKLYAAVDWNDTLGGTSAVYVRATDGTWAVSDSGVVSADVDGKSRGYSSLVVWPAENRHVTSPTPALYAVRRDVAADADTGCVRKFNGSAWTTVKTYDFDNTGASNLQFTYTISGGVIKPAMWLGGAALLLNTTDGTTWTDRSAGLTAQAAITCVSAGFAGMILQA